MSFWKRLRAAWPLAQAALMWPVIRMILEEVQDAAPELKQFRDLLDRAYKILTGKVAG